MRAVLLLVGLIACSSLARAWEVCEPRNYDCKFKVVKGKFYDCVAGQFAREAVANSAAKVAPLIIADPTTAVYSGCKVAGIWGHRGCYYSVKAYKGKQLKGIYDFDYVLTFKCPNGATIKYDVQTTHQAVRTHPHFVGWTALCMMSNPPSAICEPKWTELP